MNCGGGSLTMVQLDCCVYRIYGFSIVDRSYCFLPHIVVCCRRARCGQAVGVSELERPCSVKYDGFTSSIVASQNDPENEK